MQKNSCFFNSPLKGCEATENYKANICFYLENVEEDNNHC